MARLGGHFPALIDAEMVALRLYRHRLLQRALKLTLRLVGTQRRAEIDPLAAAKAGIELTRRRDPDTVATATEIFGERRNHPQPAAGFPDPEIARGAAGVVGQRGER